MDSSPPPPPHLELFKMLQFITSLLSTTNNNKNNNSVSASSSSTTGVIVTSSSTKCSDEDNNPKIVVDYKNVVNNNNTKNNNTSSLLRLDTLSVPSFSIMKNHNNNKKKNNNNHHHTKTNTTILKQLIMKGNPYPPKTSYAKGKKKLQKRRRSSSGKKQLLNSVTVVQNCENNNNNNVMMKIINENDYEVNDELCHQLDVPLIVKAVVGIKDKEEEEKGEEGTQEKKEKQETSYHCDTQRQEQQEQTIDEIKQVAKTLNQNIKDIVNKALSEKLISFTSSLLYKNIKDKNGIISYNTAKILAATTHRRHYQQDLNESELQQEQQEQHSYVTPEDRSDDDDNDNNNSTESDNVNESQIIKEHLVDNDRQSSSLSSSSSNTMKPQLVEDKNTEIVVDHVAKIKSIHQNQPSLKCMLGLENETVDHVAKIKSIHDNSPSLRELLGLEKRKREVNGENNNEEGTQDDKKTTSKKDAIISNRIENCSTSFTITDLEKLKDVEGGDETFSVPIHFQTFLSIVILKHSEMMTLDTTGTIKGSTTKNSLMDLKVTLDIDSLIKSVVDKVNRIIKGVILSNRSYAHIPHRRIEVIPTEKTFSSKANSYAHIQSVMNNHTTLNATTSRKRPHSDINSSDKMIDGNLQNLMAGGLLSDQPFQRMLPRNSFGPTSNLVTTMGSPATINNNSLNNGYQQFHNGLHALIADSNNQVTALELAERARLQELQKAMDTDQQRNSFRNSFRNSSSMAIAAEAVRLAEMTNQLDSIGNRYFVDTPNNNATLNFNNRLSNLGYQDSSNADLMRLFEINQRRSSSVAGLTTTASELASILDPYQGDTNAAVRRRSSYANEQSTMENVLNALRRRSSTGNSIAAAAEAITIAEMDIARAPTSLRRHARPSVVAAAEAITIAERESNNRSLQRRESRSSVGTHTTMSSVAAAAEIIRMTELQNMNSSLANPYMRNIGRNSFSMLNEDNLMNPYVRCRSSSGLMNNSLTAAATEVSRLGELELNAASHSQRTYLPNPNYQDRDDSLRGHQTIAGFRQNNLNDINRINNGFFH